MIGLIVFVFAANDFGLSRKTISDPSSETDTVLDPFLATSFGVDGGRLMVLFDSLLVNGARLPMVVDFGLLGLVGVGAEGIGSLKVVIQSLSLSCLVGVSKSSSWYSVTTPYFHLAIDQMLQEHCNVPSSSFHT